VGVGGVGGGVGVGVGGVGVGGGEEMSREWEENDRMIRELEGELRRRNDEIKMMTVDGVDESDVVMRASDGDVNKDGVSNGREGMGGIPDGGGASSSRYS
jgi:hypothetical protein